MLAVGRRRRTAGRLHAERGRHADQRQPRLDDGRRDPGAGRDDRRRSGTAAVARPVAWAGLRRVAGRRGGGRRRRRPGSASMSGDGLVLLSLLVSAVVHRGPDADAARPGPDRGDGGAVRGGHAGHAADGGADRAAAARGAVRAGLPVLLGLACSRCAVHAVRLRPVAGVGRGRRRRSSTWSRWSARPSGWPPSATRSAWPSWPARRRSWPASRSAACPVVSPRRPRRPRRLTWRPLELAAAELTTAGLVTAELLPAGAAAEARRLRRR